MTERKTKRQEEPVHDEAKHYEKRSMPDGPASSLMDKVTSGEYKFVKGKLVRVG